MNRNAIRTALVVGVLLSSSVVAAGYLAAHERVTASREAPPANGTTVVTTQGTPFEDAYIAAYDSSGDVVFWSREWNTYFDVDPAPSPEWDVEFVASNPLPSDQCSTSRCASVSIVRANFSTNETDVIYREVDVARWHDVDRVGEHRLLITDIRSDELALLDTRTGLRLRSWRAAANFDPTSSGGEYPSDWTHINDVERLPDGRTMISLRNHDQVLFLDPDWSINESWTLGSDGNYSTVFEPHNPDYIPKSNGGPAVLIADSENDRVVEYQRVDGEWRQTWVWSDPQLSWGRDADRLPSGRTLIADSHGDRVVEVDRTGEVVWSIQAPNVYEVERLGTGDESSGGPSARRAELESRAQGTSSASVEAASSSILALFPPKLVHSMQFITPSWFDLVEFVGAVVGFGSLALLVCFEAYWRGVRIRSPIEVIER